MLQVWKGTERGSVVLDGLSSDQAHQVRSCILEQIKISDSPTGKVKGQRISVVFENRAWSLDLSGFNRVGFFPVQYQSGGASKRGAVEIKPVYGADEHNINAIYDMDRHWSETLFSMDAFVAARRLDQNRCPTSHLRFHAGHTFAVDREESRWDDQVLRDQLVLHAARQYAAAAETLVGSGLPQGFEETAGRLDVLRGRPDFAAQIRHGAGLEFPIHCKYDMLSEDIRPNRAIRAAAGRLVELFPRRVGTNVNVQVRNGIAEAEAQKRAEADLLASLQRLHQSAFPAVSPEAPDPPMALAEMTDVGGWVGAEYETALFWAIVVLSSLHNISPASSAWTAEVPGFSVCMDDLAQDWTGYRIEQMLSTDERWRAPYPVEDKWCLGKLEHDTKFQRIECNPDFLVLGRETNRPALVLDFKNKAKSNWDRQDLQQINMFMDACGAPGMIVYSPRAADCKVEHFSHALQVFGGSLVPPTTCPEQTKKKQVHVFVLESFLVENSTAGMNWGNQGASRGQVAALVEKIRNLLQING